MAIGDDFSVAVNGDIRHVSGTAHYTVLELHRWLQNLADDAAASSSGNDLVDIVSDTPSERVTNQIINLLGNYNIDDDAAKYLYGGSISQSNGDVIYSGLKVLGSVNNTNTQLTIVQDNSFYDSATSPFWGDQSTGGYNGDSTAGVLMRILVKSRTNGFDIDGKRIRVQARHWGDTYDFFDVTLGTGEAVAAISTTPDAQNDRSQSTVTAWTHVLNSGGTANAPTGGYQLIDINDGNGNQPYYSKWTYGADPTGYGMKDIYEYLKDLSGTGTSKTVDSLSGDRFLGITHQWNYTGLSSAFTERETLAWGTKLSYSDLSSAFTVGNYVIVGSCGVAGKIVNRTTGNPTGSIWVALEDTSKTIGSGTQIVEWHTTSGQTGVTATATGIADNDKDGGEALLLADDGTDTLWVQLLSGVAPANNLEFRGRASGAYATLSSAFVSRTVPKIFLGSYTGSLIGAFGIGVKAADLGYPDTVQDLDGDTNSAPNNVTFTVGGLVAGEDRVLVATKSTSASDFFKSQMSTLDTLASSLSSIAVTTAAIPSDSPSAGTIRVQLDVGTYRRCSYDSFTTSVFNLSSALDFNGNNSSTSGSNLFISYIDKLATASNESFTVVYSADRTLWIRVRDGGSTPIKTFETAGTLGSGGGSVTAIRTADA